ncbi:MAG: hypothetical protein R3E51_04505 [Rhizobiaceae bacterium]
MLDLEHLLRLHLADWQSGWSMGTFGAIAEFHQDEGETPVIDDSFALTRATRRGAIRIERRKLAEVRAVAYETLSPKRHRWSQGVALCLPERRARREARSVLTELGPDDGAIRGIDRTGILFDMGLSLPQCDFCIRTSDPKLLGELRANLGRSLFDHNNRAMPAILASHPHRVALTNIGRIEVYQKIGGPDTGGVSPPGPHTHLLPKLLRTGRTHSANTPIPEGLMPLGALHPGNPVIGPMGEEKDFDPELHANFQKLLEAYGDREAVETKRRVLAAIDSGKPPADREASQSRHGRAALRVALRQMEHLARAQMDASRLACVVEWLKAYERDDDMAEDDAPGH